MASLYPAQLLVLPLRVQERLPPALQSVDVEAVMVMHAGLSLFASFFWVHPPYALPLALFGLVASTPALVTSLLPHFLAMWIVSVALDVAWLVHRSDQARSIIIILIGFNMLLKVVSALQAARILQAQGALPDIGGGFNSSARQTNAFWNGSSGTTTGPFGLPGSWSGQGNYRDAPSHSPAAGAGSSPYRSIYDEEAQAHDDDAPQVRVENVANSVAAAAAAAKKGQRAKEEEQARSQYRTLE